MRATARLTRVAVNSVVATLRDAGPVAATFHDHHVRRVSPKRVELDESWNFVGAKRKNAPTAKVAEAGDIWLWLAMDPATKLLISYLLGGRNARMAEGLVRDLDGRIETIPHFCTDGYAPYEKAIWNVFGPEAPYTQLVFDEKRVISGDPDVVEAGTSFIERLNLSLRMENRRYTRRTNAFSKSTEQHLNQVCLWVLYYNWVRHHRAVKTTPAVAAGLVGRPLPMAWIAELVEARHETASELYRRTRWESEIRLCQEAD